MYIVATHTISNPEKFWSLAKAMTVPPSLKLHSVFPSTDGAMGSCLWEAQSVDALKEFLDPATSGIAKNDFMAVAAGNAIGLPK